MSEPMIQALIDRVGKVTALIGLLIIALIRQWLIYFAMGLWFIACGIPIVGFSAFIGYNTGTGFVTIFYLAFTGVLTHIVLVIPVMHLIEVTYVTYSK